MIKIINLSDADPLEAAGAEYVGRAMPRQRRRGSPLGNPHKIDAKAGITRDMCIQRYQQDIADAIQAESEYRCRMRNKPPTVKQARIVAELNRLALSYLRTGRLTLACWCHPQSCHANVVATIIEQTAAAISRAVGQRQRETAVKLASARGGIA